MYTNIIHNDDICNYFLKNQQFIFNSLGNCRECRIYEMIRNGRYEEVRHIDSLYGYYLPQDVDETDALAVKESIESVYVA